MTGANRGLGRAYARALLEAGRSQDLRGFARHEHGHADGKPVSAPYGMAGLARTPVVPEVTPVGSEHEGRRSACILRFVLAAARVLTFAPQPQAPPL